MTWARYYNLYVDINAPGGAQCLLEALTSPQYAADPEWIQYDVFTIRVYFRERSDNGTGSTTEVVQLDSGDGIVLSGKNSSDLDGDELFRAVDWTEAGSGDEIYYYATLNLATIADSVFTAAGADEITCAVDLEVSAADGSSRISFRFSVTLNRQVYAGGVAPIPVASITGRWEEYDNANGAKCLRIKNSDGDTLITAAPAGEQP